MNPFTPHITVATIVEKNGRFLFVRERSAGQLVLNQPAGHVEHGESLAQAAFRETLEETAWSVSIDAFLGLYIFQPRPGAGIFYRSCFIGTPQKHFPHQRLDKGIEEAVWLTPTELAEQQASHRGPLVQQCMNDYLSGRRLPLDTIYEHPWPLQKA